MPVYAFDISCLTNYGFNLQAHWIFYRLIECQQIWNCILLSLFYKKDRKYKVSDDVKYDM